MFNTFREVIEREKVEAEVEKLEESPHLVKTGCMGLCEAGPLVRVEPEGGSLFKSRARRCRRNRK